mmetsp:Transcript_582/g.972  ORF Transcript_582/g.972 Transcript_582/m.972 type:complete len:207 (+) Transcript_582:1856-2476(+)
MRMGRMQVTCKRLARSAIMPALLRVRSRANTSPTLFINAPICVVLPPGAAHMSRMRSPGCGLSIWATKEDGTFCRYMSFSNTPCSGGESNSRSVICTARPASLRKISVRPCTATPLPRKIEPPLRPVVMKVPLSVRPSTSHVTDTAQPSRTVPTQTKPSFGSTQDARCKHISASKDCFGALPIHHHFWVNALSSEWASCRDKDHIV